MAVSKIQSSMLREHWGTVTGSEHELGVLAPDGSADFDSWRLPSLEFTKSGARIYEDVHHPEMSTPEASNPLQLLAVERALERRMLQLGLGVELYKNCVDFGSATDSPATFGAHENYFTCVPRDDLDALIPFLVSRVILTGSGDTSDGVAKYSISQRARHITSLRGNRTLSDRPLINERDQPLSNVPGWYRFHVIGNDANICPSAILLKHGTFMLVLRLLEQNLLESLQYSDGWAIADLHNISSQTSGWHMRGVHSSSKSAIDVQRFYLNQVATKIGIPSPLERQIISLWRESLSLLSRDPEETVGLIDWSTKRYIQKSYAEYMPDAISDEAMRSIDLEYHNIDPSKGLYFALEREHPEMRPISNQTIGHYINNPPRTTRAWMRGSSLTMVEEARSHGIPLAVTPDWGHVSVSVGDKGTSTVTIAMNDPRHPYTEKYARLRKKLGL